MSLIRSRDYVLSSSSQDLALGPSNVIINTVTMQGGNSDLFFVTDVVGKCHQNSGS
jgi:hypothetical protein